MVNRIEREFKGEVLAGFREIKVVYRRGAHGVSLFYSRDANGEVLFVRTDPPHIFVLKADFMRCLRAARLASIEAPLPLEEPVQKPAPFRRERIGRVNLRRSPAQMGLF